MNRKTFSFSAFQAFSVLAVQTALCIALVVSIGWNIQQLRSRTAAVEEAYLIGRIDGINFARSVIARVAQRMIEAEETAARQQREAEADAHIAEERL